MAALRGKYWAAFAAVALAYWAGAALGLRWSVVPGAGTSVWPASGVAFAALAIGGLRLWPAVFAGRLLTAFAVGSQQPLWADVAIALGTTAAAAVPVYALRRHRGLDPRLGNLRDMLWLTVGAGALGAVISAAAGGGALLASGTPPETAARAVLNWAFGYGVGLLVFAPLLMSWWPRQARQLSARDRLHLAGCLITTGIASALVFLSKDPSYLRAWHILPVLVWTAVAFQVRGVSLGLLVTSVFAIVGAVNHTGPFAEAELTVIEQTLMTQQFLGMTAVTMLLLAAAIDERRDVEVNARLAAVVSSSPEAMISYSPEGRIQTWNPGAESLFGYAASEAIGQGGELLVPPDAAEGIGGVFAIAMRDGRASLETVRVAKSGERVEVAVTASRMEAPDGTVLGVAAVMRDVRAKNRAERELRDVRGRLDAALDAAKIGTWTWALPGGPMLGDRNIADLFGLTDEEAAGASVEPYRSRIHPDDRRQVERSMGEAMAGGEYRAVYRVLLPGGGLRWHAARGRARFGADGEAVSLDGAVLDITELREAQEGLADSRATLEAFFETDTILASVVELDGDEVRFVTSNRPFARFFGRDDVTGASAAELLGSHPAAQFADALGRIASTGAPSTFEHRAPGGDRWFAATISPIGRRAGGRARFATASLDITQRKKSEAHLRLLINELNHRAKNLLAIIQGIAQQSFRGDGASPAARAAFEGRLAALSAAHDVLTRENWEHAEFRDILSDAVAPFQRSDRGAFVLSGPDLRLPPKTAVSFALAFHELSTNAAKYGALSNDAGRVLVDWAVIGDRPGRLKLTWREEGGPPVVEPTRRGFGSRMIERGLAAELGGLVRVSYPAEGVVCEIDAPLPDAPFLDGRDATRQAAE